jgi:hypothetical protein
MCYHLLLTQHCSNRLQLMEYTLWSPQTRSIQSSTAQQKSSPIHLRHPNSTTCRRLNLLRQLPLTVNFSRKTISNLPLSLELPPWSQRYLATREVVCRGSTLTDRVFSDAIRPLTEAQHREGTREPHLQHECHIINDIRWTNIEMFSLVRLVRISNSISVH